MISDEQIRESIVLSNQCIEWVNVESDWLSGQYLGGNTRLGDYVKRREREREREVQVDNNIIGRVQHGNDKIQW